METTELIAIVLGGIAVLKFGADIIKFIVKPNIDQDTKISQIESRISVIETNHLFHLEADVKSIFGAISAMKEDIAFIKGKFLS